MIELFTLDELILYYFNETQLAETVTTQKAIDWDPEIAEEFNCIVEIFKRMDEMCVSPSDKCMQSIFDYSKKTTVQKN